MPAPTTLRTPINTIITALLANLATYTGLSAELVKLWRFDDHDLPPLADGADKDLVVQISGPVPNAAIVEGGGRADTRLTRHAVITIRTRFGEIDELSSALFRLTDANSGHYVLEESVIDAMQLWAPMDSTGNELLVQPARLAPSDGTRGVPKSPHWTTSQQSWEIIYEASLTQTRF